MATRPGKGKLRRETETKNCLPLSIFAFQSSPGRITLTICHRTELAREFHQLFPRPHDADLPAEFVVSALQVSIRLPTPRQVQRHCAAAARFLQRHARDVPAAVALLV